MKILYLITKANWGGAQKYVYDMTLHMRRAHGATVSVLYGEEGALATKLRDENIDTKYIPSLGRDISFGNDIRAFLAIHKEIREARPEVLHLNSSKVSGIGALVGRICRVPKIVFTVHGAPFREDRNRLIKYAMYFFTWLTCLLSTDVICVSKRDLYDISHMWGIQKKARLVYLGILYGDTPKRVSERTRTSRIVSIGELHKNKGYAYMLQAVKKLLDRGEDIRYEIFGEGEERLRLEQMIVTLGISHAVTLHGYDPSAKEKIKEYDIYVMPSVKEGLPWVLIEAGSMQLPVIASITGGVPEIIQHEETGLLVTPKDVDGIVDAILRMRQDRRFARRLGEHLRARLVQNFSEARMYTETAVIYGLYAKN